MTAPIDRRMRHAAVYGAFVVNEVREHRRLRGDWPDDERMQAIVEDALTVADQAGEAWDRMVEDGLTRVCPGCHAVGEERCAPGCIDAELEEECRQAIESGDYDCMEEEEEE